MRNESDDPALLSPHQRLLELASIFAAGVQRLRTRPCVVDELDEDASRPDLASSAPPGPDREQGECDEHDAD